MAFNKVNHVSLDSCTAKQIALLVVEGVDVWATDLEWRRINKRLRQMGLVDNGFVEVCHEVNLATVEGIVTAGIDMDAEVWGFLNDMSIMGMVSDTFDAPCPPMWGTSCLN